MHASVYVVVDWMVVVFILEVSLSLSLLLLSVISLCGLIFSFMWGKEIVL